MILGSMGEVEHLKRLFNVKVPEFPGLVRTVPIINSICYVRILLYFQYGEPWSQSVNGPRGYLKDLAGFGVNHVHYVVEFTICDTGCYVLFRQAFFPTHDDEGFRFGLQNNPHFFFPV